MSPLHSDVHDGCSGRRGNPARSATAERLLPATPYRVSRLHEMWSLHLLKNWPQRGRCRVRDATSNLEIVMMSITRGDSTITFRREDGKEARFSLHSPMFSETSQLASLHVALGEGEFTGDALLATTTFGDPILFELPLVDEIDQLEGRLMVYLDQNQWRALGEANNPASRVAEADRSAARRLIELVREREVVLPASAAHYHETTKWTDDAGRYRLGLSILQHSHGWQLRDPLQVRRDEIQASFQHVLFGGPQPVADSTVTLFPDVLHGEVRGGPAIEVPPDFPPSMAALHRALVSASALIDVMLDTEHIPAQAPTGWTAANQAFSDWLDTERLDSNQKRKCIDSFLLGDLASEIAEEAFRSGLTVDQVGSWMSSGGANIALTPGLGLYREMVQDRHLKAGLTWHPNDLTDMVYLSTAAGYADVIVCERSMGTSLHAGLRRLGRPTSVFRRLSEALPAIETLLGSRGRGTAVDGRRVTQ